MSGCWGARSFGVEGEKICLVGWSIGDTEDAIMIMQMGKMMMTMMTKGGSRAKMGSDFTSHGCQPGR